MVAKASEVMNTATMQYPTSETQEGCFLTHSSGDLRDERQFFVAPASEAVALG